MITKYTLELFLSGIKVEIPDFLDKNQAHMAGMFLMLCHPSIQQFNTKEIKVIINNS